MNHIKAPKIIYFKDLDNKKSFLPSNYKKLDIDNENLKPLREFIELPLEGGKEVGSDEYITDSNKYFVRTGALQESSFFIEEYAYSESIVPIRPQVFEDNDLKEGDILICKDSNVGEVVYLDKDYPNYMLCSGLKKLKIKKYKFYLLAFLKNDFFKEQLNYLIEKGSTIKHAKTKFLDCNIPFPNQENSLEVIEYISKLVKSIIKREKKIRELDKIILKTIEKELELNQKNTFIYNLPTFNELKESNRLDTGLYNEATQTIFSQIENYKYGFKNIFELLTYSRGQNLQVSAIGESIKFEKYQPNFYKLYYPKNITTYGTIGKVIYLGNENELKCIEEGDLVIGAEGYKKGRSFVVVNDILRTITNIHGLVLKSKNNNLNNSIFIRCFLHYLRNKGVLDQVGAGSNGGSLAKKYLKKINIPIFPDDKEKEIAKYYHNPIKYDNINFNFNNFEELDDNIINNSGILQLDNSIKKMKKKLNNIVKQIAHDNRIKIEFDFLKK